MRTRLINALATDYKYAGAGVGLRVVMWRLRMEGEVWLVGKQVGVECGSKAGDGWWGVDRRVVGVVGVDW